ADAVGEIAVARRALAARARGAGGGSGQAVRSLARQHRLDRRVRAFQRRGEPRDFRSDVVDALAQERVFDPLGGPSLFGFALDGGEIARQPVSLVGGAGELGFQPRLFTLEPIGRRRRASFERDDRGAQFAFDGARHGQLVAQVLDLDLALRQQLRLLLERALHLAGAAPEHVGFRRLRGQALLELGHAARQALDLAAFLIQFLGGGAQLDALSLAAVFHRLDLFAGRRQPLFECLYLRLVREDLDLLR